MTASAPRALLPLALVCSIAVFSLLPSLQRGWTQVETDFPNYYTAAALTLRHQPLQQFYEWNWFQRQMNYTGTERQLGAYGPQTPLTMLPLLPIAWLDPQRAKQVWLFFGLLCLAGSVALLARLTALPAAAILALSLLSWRALSDNLIYGQYYLFLLLLLVLAVWCLLRDRPLTGGALMGLIFVLKLYTLPLLFFFAVRRQWRAMAGMLAAIAALAGASVALFGPDAVWFFVTTVMSRTLDAANTDPYNTGWSSMAAFLRHTLMSETELNPHPFLNAPALFFWLRDFYAFGILGLTLAALARDWRDERRALAWFLIVLFVISPNPAQYHFLLLLVPVALLLPGASALWAAGLLALYTLTELPLYAWDEWLFPRAWLLVALFLYVGWSSLRALGGRWAVAVLTLALAVAGLRARRQTILYQAESTRVAARAVTDPDNIYSSAPSVADGRMVFEKIGDDRYVLRESIGGTLRNFTFEGHAFHPALSRAGGSVYFELAARGHSRICAFDPATQTLETVVAAEMDPTEPAISPDGTSLAFVSHGSIYLRQAGAVRLLWASALASGPAFFPDGRRLAFAEGPPGRRILHSIRLDGGEPDMLVDDGDTFEPAVSPDGRRLAYARGGTGDRQVWIVDLESRARRELTAGVCQNDAPAWRSDSHAVVFASDCDRGLGLPALFVIQAPAQ